MFGGTGAVPSPFLPITNQDGTAPVPPNYFPVALMRLAFVGSVPNVTLTVMPGFKSAAVAFWPFTVISVN